MDLHITKHEIDQAIQDSFHRDKELMPFLSDVLRIESTDIEAAEGRGVGDVERKVYLLINAVGQAALSTLKFNSRNGNSFLGILGDNAAVESYLSFLRRSTFTRQCKILIKWAKKERYGVQGGLREREVFGKGTTAIDVGINPYQNVANIYLGTGTSSTSLVAVVSGGLHGGPDELYLNGCIVRGRGHSPYLPIDTPPDISALKTLAALAGKRDHKELRFIVPFGERHISPTKGEQGKGSRLIDALYQAGIPFTPVEYETIKETMTQQGVYKNGNITVVSNVFPAVFDLIAGKADVILGVDIAGHYAQAVFLLKAFGVAEGVFRFASFDTLRDRRHPEDAWPDIYQNTFTDIDLGTLKKYRVFPDHVPIDRKQRQLHVSDILDMNRFIETDNGAMIIAGIRNFNRWVEGLDDPAFNDDMSEVTVSFLVVGLSEKRRIAVTYKTVIGELLTHAETAEKDYALAEAYLEFGDFLEARSYLKRATTTAPSEDFKNGCTVLETYLTMIKGLTAEEDPSLEVTLGRVSDPRFSDQFERAMQTLSRMETSAHIPIEAVRTLMPQLATLMKKTGQHIGDISRTLGQTALEEAEHFRVESNETSQGGDVERAAMATFLEEKSREDVRRRAAHALFCYESALKFFPGEGKRTERQQLEYQLYVALMRLVRHLKDFDPRRITDHFVRQRHYYTLFEIYVDIARIYEQNGFNLRAIYFYKRACEQIENFGELGIAGIVPLTARLKIPELYIQEGWYELARKEYRALTDRKYLETRCNMGPGDDSALYVEAALRKVIIGYLLMEAFCRNAVDPSHMIIDPNDTARTAYSELEGFFLTRFKEFIIDEHDHRIYGIGERNGSSVLLGAVRA